LCVCHVEVERPHTLPSLLLVLYPGVAELQFV
jgi:hypothetical protein